MPSINNKVLQRDPPRDAVEAKKHDLDIVRGKEELERICNEMRDPVTARGLLQDIIGPGKTWTALLLLLLDNQDTSSGTKTTRKHSTDPRS